MSNAKINGVKITDMVIVDKPRVYIKSIIKFGKLNPVIAVRYEGCEKCYLNRKCPNNDGICFCNLIKSKCGVMFARFTRPK